jgi:hypothetical protein
LATVCEHTMRTSPSDTKHRGIVRWHTMRRHTMCGTGGGSLVTMVATKVVKFYTTHGRRRHIVSHKHFCHNGALRGLGLAAFCAQRPSRTERSEDPLAGVLRTDPSRTLASDSGHPDGRWCVRPSAAQETIGSSVLVIGFRPPFELRRPNRDTASDGLSNRLGPRPRGPQRTVPGLNW